MWKINIKAPFNGYLNKYYLESDMTVGQSSQANDMSCIDFTRMSSITSGFKPQAGGTTYELVTAISNSDGSNHFGIGNTRLFKISTTGASTSDATWPHTITGASIFGNLSNVIVYDGTLYYFWNSLTAANIGKCTTPSGTPTFDDDWGTTVAGGTFTKLVNKPMIVNSNNYLLFGNGQYLGTYDGVTLDSEFYDFGSRNTVEAITEQSAYTYVAVNNIEGKGFIYLFDSSMTGNTYVDYINVGDKITALYAINGIIYVFHQESIGQDLSKVGYVSGNRIVDLPMFHKGTPLSKGVDFAGDVLFFNTDDETLGISTPYASNGFILSSPLEPKYSTIGGLRATKNALLVASSDADTNHYISQYALSASGKGINAYWTSKTFEVADVDQLGMIESIEVKTKRFATNRECELSIYVNRSSTAYRTLTISTASETRHIFRNLNIAGVKEFKIKLDFSSGDGGSLVYLESISIKGHNYEL
jgi:hypothetical protein